MKTYALAGNIIGRKPQNGGNGGGYREEVAYTMDTIGNFGIAQVEDDMNTFEHHPQDSRVKQTEVAPTCGVFGNSIEGKDCLVQQEPYVKTCRAKGADGLGERWESKQVSPTLNVFDTGDKRSKDIKEGDRQTTGIGKEGDPCPTLQTEHHHAVASHLSVRRLLPIECERLMGMPDNWTRIPWRGKPADECPDAPRYKACGNSMGVNCMRWIGLGIEAVENDIRKGNH